MALKKCNLVFYFLLIYSIIVIILRFDFSVFLRHTKKRAVIVFASTLFSSNF